MNSHMSGNIPTDILVTNTTNSSLEALFQKLGSVRVMLVPVTLIVGGV